MERHDAAHGPPEDVRALESEPACCEQHVVGVGAGGVGRDVVAGLSKAGHIDGDDSATVGGEQRAEGAEVVGRPWRAVEQDDGGALVARVAPAEGVDGDRVA